MPILPFPTFRQMYDYDCGASAIQGLLAYYGTDVRGDKIIAVAKTAKRQGTSITNLKLALENFGLPIRAKTMSLADLKRSISNRQPVLLPLQAWATAPQRVDWKSNWNDGHYVIAIGYDRQHIYFADPASVFRTHLTPQELDERWHDIDSATGEKYDHFGITVIRKKPAFQYKKTIHMD